MGQAGISGELLPVIFGNLDENIIKIEKAFGVNIVNRGGRLAIVGENAEFAQEIVRKLLHIADSGEEINETTVNYLIDSMRDGTIGQIGGTDSDTVILTTTGKAIKPKTLGQKKYVETIRRETIIFGVGPAGTGKTYLAMAMAIAAFKKNDVDRIILTRPAIEAGEKLGFLPGDLQQKVDPYLRPLYDALFEIMGAEAYHRNLEKGAIEIAPLAYMRGRTLDNSFIVLDEAQNTTPEQMKMFLTRIGFGSKVVVTGDITQIDLPGGTKSGLKDVLTLLEDVEGIGICMFTNKDVVRHPLVQRIIKAYEKRDAKAAYKEKRKIKLKSSK
ncbi:MAG: PhoH family protein [Clostridiales bacterium]|jgi:phosphate starvation-inducible PhoH-like protein|nr:PhoH family protein [Clostridiales bacterium]